MKHIVNSLFEDLRKDDSKWYERILWSSLRYFRDIKYFFRCTKEWFKYGFPLSQVWEFRSWHSEIVVPRLKILRDRNMGHPNSVTEDEWRTILDKMIWSFENNDFEPGPKYSDDYDHRYEVTELPNGSKQYTSMNTTGTIDWSERERHYEKVQEGLDLFSKWYLNLWS